MSEEPTGARGPRDEGAYSDPLEIAAEIAGAFAERGIGEVAVNGRVVRAREGVDLPGLIVRELERGGTARVCGGGMEVELGGGRWVWRGRE